MPASWPSATCGGSGAPSLTTQRTSPRSASGVRLRGQHQLEQEYRADVQRFLGLDEGATLRDVLRVIVEERVQPLVLDLELDGSACFSASVVFVGHTGLLMLGPARRAVNEAARPVRPARAGLGGPAGLAGGRPGLRARCSTSSATTSASRSGWGRRWRRSTSGTAWSPSGAGRTARRRCCACASPRAGWRRRCWCCRC